MTAATVIRTHCPLLNNTNVRNVSRHPDCRRAGRTSTGVVESERELRQLGSTQYAAFLLITDAPCQRTHECHHHPAKDVVWVMSVRVTGLAGRGGAGAGGGAGGGAGRGGALGTAGLCSYSTWSEQEPHYTIRMLGDA